MPFKAERRCHQIWSVDIRYLDMHSLQGIEIVDCISILKFFALHLASATSVRQDTEAFFAVFYAAVRRYGVPDAGRRTMAASFFPTTPGGYVRSSASRKRRSKKENPIKITLEAAFGVQRRMADASFEKAQTWEDLLAAHDTWMRDYNFQKHMAHEERPDGCHSPAEVLGLDQGYAAS